MTVTDPANVSAANACPYLGLADDPATHFAFPSGAQRCHAGRRPLTIDLPKQARDCLTAAHVTCPRYRPARRPIVVAGVPTERVWPDDPRVRPDDPRVEPDGREGRSPVRRAGRRLLLLAVALAATVLVGALIGFAIVAQLGQGSSTPAPGAVVASPSPLVTAVTSATPTSSPTPAPTGTASVVPSPTASPSAPATERPRPSPRSEVRIHLVRRGDTLISIAARYGVTVAAIRGANEIDDPNLIIVGQRLVIPRR